MKKRKIHIDHLFRNAFSHLNLPISDSDLNEVNKKMYKKIENSPIHNFELPISDNDWLLTKTKLNLAQEVNKHNKPFSSLKDFEIPVTNKDWKTVKNKLRERKNRKVIFFLIPMLLIFVCVIFYYFKPDSIGKNNKVNQIANKHNVLKNSTKKNSHNNNVNIIEKKVEIESLNENKTIKSYPKSKVNLNYDLSNNFKENKENNFTERYDIKEANIKPIDGEVIENILRINLKKQLIYFKNHEEITLLKNILPEIKKPIPGPNIYLGLNTEILNQSTKLSKNNPSNYNNVRSKDEKSFVVSQNGLVFGLDFKKINIQIGINHLTFQNTTSYNYGVLIHDSIPVYDPKGILIGHFLLNPRYKQTNETVIKRISSIMIPIHIQKSVKINSKNSLISGLGFNTEWVYLQKQNKYLDPNRIQHIKNNSKIYSQFNIQSSMFLGVRTKLYKNWVIQSGITGNYQLNNAMKQTIKIKENPYNFGVNLKLLYYIK